MGRNNSAKIMKTNTLSIIAIENLLASARRECSDIALGLTLQAYAGLRSSEIPELRATGCSDGGSLLIDDTKVTVSLGLKRIMVPNEFSGIVKATYESHISFLADKCVDIRFPLFINTNGTALSIEGYLRRVKQFNDFILTSESPSLSEIRQYLAGTSRRFTADMLRHWYAANILNIATQKYKIKGRKALYI